MTGTLYVVATPIGNLEDLTLRALRVLKEADLIACEDTRRTRGLLTHFGIHAPVTSYFEHNKLAKGGVLLRALAEVAPTARVALCRELTKLYEEVVRGSAVELSTALADRELKGEIAVVVSGGASVDPAGGAEEALAAVAELVAAGIGSRQASALVARLTGQPRRALYDAAARCRRGG